jgi:hypothetical protein
MQYKVSNNINTKSGEHYYDEDEEQMIWREPSNNGSFDFPFDVTVHDFVSSGYLISDVYNTNNPGTDLDYIQWSTEGISGVTSIHIYTWSAWLDQTSYYGSLNPSTPSPHGQYLQYKLELASDDNCYTPYFDAVWIYYT